MTTHNIQKGFILLLVGALLIAALTGCGSSSSSTAGSADAASSESTAPAASEPENAPEADAGSADDVQETSGYESILDYHYTGDPITIVLADIPSFYPFAVASAAGIFDQVFEGDNVSFEFYTIEGSGPIVAQTLAADQADFGFLGDNPAIAGIAGGYDITIIAKNQNSLNFYPLVATTASGITSVSEVAGHKVGINFGTSQHLLTLQYLEKEGISEDDVEIIQTSDLLSLLLSGDIDVAIAAGNSADALIEQGEVIKLADEADYGIRQLAVLAGRNAFIEEYPELTAKFLYALQLTSDWIYENPDLAVKYAAEHSQYDETSARSILDGNNIEPALSAEDLEALQKLLDFLEGNDLIEDTSLTLDDIVDTQYLELAGIQ